MPKTPSKITIKFSASALTHFGGAYLLQQFFQRLALRKRLSNTIHMPERNAQYFTSELISTLVYQIILGFGRIEPSQLLKHNGVLRYLTGLPSYPDATTSRRFLLRLGECGLQGLHKVHDHYRRVLLSQPRHLSRAIFDFDTSVLTVFGQQEKARVGYNPKKRGRRSYHPLFCFEGQTADCWASELYPGDMHPAPVVMPFLETVLAKLPPSIRRKYFRGDSAFFDGDLVHFHNSHGIGYVIVARLTKPIKRRLSSLKYQKVSLHLETAEFTYQPYRWKAAQRFVVIRRPLPEEPSWQLSLFKMGDYTYQVLVTNLRLKPVNVWRFYNRRATAELVIRELKESYATGKIPTKFFKANMAFFQLTLFAYNLLNWFKRLCLPKEYQRMTLQTIRSKLIAVPAELVFPQNKPTLKFSKNYPYRKVFMQTLKNIQKVQV